jgi:hypothetical protein
MDFTKANMILGTKDRKKVDNNTYLERIDLNTIGLRLHRTYVVVYKLDGSIVLNSGGWLTRTTKERMTTYSPYHIFQKKHIWSVWNNGKLVGLYKDDMKIDNNGRKVA